MKSSSTRVSTIGSVKPAMKNIFERSARFVLRSGRYASHVSYESASGSGKMISSKYSGWRGGVLAACCSAGLVLFVNLVFAIFGLVVSKSGTKVGTLMSGECGKVGNIDTWMHIIINIAGTVSFIQNYFLEFLLSRGVVIRALDWLWQHLTLPKMRNPVLVASLPNPITNADQNQSFYLVQVISPCSVLVRQPEPR